MLTATQESTVEYIAGMDNEDLLHEYKSEVHEAKTDFFGSSRRIEFLDFAEQELTRRSLFCKHCGIDECDCEFQSGQRTVGTAV